MSLYVHKSLSGSIRFTGVYRFASGSIKVFDIYEHLLATCWDAYPSSAALLSQFENNFGLA